MTLSRIELDGIGSPAGLAARIHELAPDLPLDFSIEDVCRRLDIEDIRDERVHSFAAMLLMEPNRAWGAIVVAKGMDARRRRFSIGHELGHFLLENHRPREGHHQFACSHADLRFEDSRGADRARKMEAEANRFAAQLLMPARRILTNLRSREPDLREIIHLAKDFNVSKAAMARSYIDAHRAILALVVLRDGRLDQVYKPDGFPWIAPSIGAPVPPDSIANDRSLSVGHISEMKECDPETWLSESATRNVEVLSEQVMVQTGGWVSVLLYAEMPDEG